MPWESRGQQRYYYTARRVGRRVVKTYVGGGSAGKLVSRIEEQKRQLVADERDFQAFQLAEDRQGVAEAEVALGATAGVLGAWLVSVGFHRPKRGAWRPKRGFIGEVDMTLTTRKSLTEWRTNLLTLNGIPRPQANPKTKRIDTAALGEYLAAEPTAVALLGDLTRHVVEHYADKYAHKSQMVAAGVVRRADELRHALAGDTPTPIEVLLAERAVVCWVALHVLESVAVDQAFANDYRRALANDRRVDAAHRRFLSTLQTLATVRRLKLPDLLAVVSITAPEPEPA